MSQQSARTPQLETKQADVERQVSVAPKEKVYTAAGHERHHAPISEALEPKDATHFRFIAETPPSRATGAPKPVATSTPTTKGFFYSQDGKPISQEAALDGTLPEGREHSIKYGQGLGIGRYGPLIYA